jgi:DNA-binding XRE family transcriptional regulator
MRKKKKSKRTRVPVLPPLSVEALNDVQETERYAHQELRACETSGHFNTHKAERIARTCVVEVLDAMLNYYESLSFFDERWVREIRESAINSVVGMLPDGYGDDLPDRFYTLLANTTYDHLNPPKKQTSKKQEPPKPNTAFADQIRDSRDECHLTTEELAEEVGLDSRTVQRHLASETQPYARHLRAYERVFSKLLERKVV